VNGDSHQTPGLPSHEISDFRGPHEARFVGSVVVSPGLDDLLDQLEVLIGRLAEPNAPLDRLVADFEAASRLVEAAQAQLAAAAGRIAQREG